MMKQFALAGIIGLAVGCAQDANSGSSVKDTSDLLNVKYTCSLEHRARNAAGVFEATRKEFSHHVVWHAGDNNAPSVSSKAELDGYGASIFSVGGILFQASINKKEVEAGKNLISKSVANELPSSSSLELDASFVGEGVFSLECKKAQ